MRAQNFGSLQTLREDPCPAVIPDHPPGSAWGCIFLCLLEVCVIKTHCQLSKTRRYPSHTKMDAHLWFLSEGNKRDVINVPHVHITQGWQPLLPLWTTPLRFNTGPAAPCSLANRKAQHQWLDAIVPIPEADNV